MLKNALIISLFLLSFLSAKAQYLGGNGDGYAMGEANNVALGEMEIGREGLTAILYPNPTSVTGGITLKINSFWPGYKDVIIYNLHGAQVYKTKILPDRGLIISMPANHFKRGIYMIRISGTGGRAIYKKFVVT